MQVTVLVIVYRGREHITLHDDNKQASRALLEFVNARWEARFGGACTATTEADRIQRFFAEDGDLYICGDADVSELSAHIAAAIND